MHRYLIFLLFLVSVKGTESVSSYSGWPLPREDTQRTGHSVEKGITSVPISKEYFQVSIPDKCHEDMTDILVSPGGETYFTCGSHFLWCYAADGLSWWTMDIRLKKIFGVSTQSIGRPVLGPSGSLFAILTTNSTYVGAVASINPDAGNFTWTKGWKDAAPFAIVPSRLQNVDVLIVATAAPKTAHLHVIKADTGAVISSVTIKSGVDVISVGPIVLSEDLNSVVVSIRHDEIRGSTEMIDLVTRRVKWTYPQPYNNLLCTTGLLLAMESRYSGSAVAFDWQTGTLVWSTDSSGIWYQLSDSLLASGREGEIFVATKPLHTRGVQIVALDHTGSQLWQSRVGACSVSSGISVTNSSLYILTCGELFALNPQTGAVMWNLNISTSTANCGDWAPLNLVVAPDGVVVAACRDKLESFSKFHFFHIRDSGHTVFNNPITIAALVTSLFILAAAGGLLGSFILENRKRLKYEPIETA